MRPVTLKGKRIILRPLRMSDAKVLLPYVNDRVMTRYMSISPPVSLAKEKGYVQKSAEGWKKGKKFTWAITMGGELVGCIDLHEVSEDRSRANVGIWVGRKLHGKGLGSEALGLVLDWAFRKMRFNRIQYLLMTPNTASRKLIEKLGGKREGLLREHYKKKGRFYNYYLYSILQREWKGR